MVKSLQIMDEWFFRRDLPSGDITGHTQTRRPRFITWLLDSHDPWHNLTLGIFYDFFGSKISDLFFQFWPCWVSISPRSVGTCVKIFSSFFNGKTQLLGGWATYHCLVIYCYYSWLILMVIMMVNNYNWVVIEPTPLKNPVGYYYSWSNHGY